MNPYHDHKLVSELQALGYPNVQSYMHAMRCKKDREMNKAERDRYLQIQRERMAAASPPTICRVVPNASRPR